VIRFVVSAVGLSGYSGGGGRDGYDRGGYDRGSYDDR